MIRVKPFIDSLENLQLKEYPLYYDYGNIKRFENKIIDYEKLKKFDIMKSKLFIGFKWQIFNLK